MLKLFVIATAMLSGLAFNSSNNQVKPLETEIKNLATTDTEYMESLFDEKISNFPSVEDGVTRLVNKYSVKLYETESYEYHGYIHFLDCKLDGYKQFDNYNNISYLDGYKGGIYFYKLNKTTNKITIIKSFESYKNYLTLGNYQILINDNSAVSAITLNDDTTYKITICGISFPVEIEKLDFTIDSTVTSDTITDYHSFYSNDKTEDLEEIYPNLVFSDEYEDVVLNEYLHATGYKEYTEIVKFKYEPKAKTGSVYVKINKLYMSNFIEDITSMGSTQRTNSSKVNIDLDYKIILENEIITEKNVKINDYNLDGFDNDKQDIGPKIKYYTRFSFVFGGGGQFYLSYDSNIINNRIYLFNVGTSEFSVSSDQCSLYGMEFDKHSPINTYFVTENDYEKGPEILGPEKLESKYSEALNKEDIISKYTAYDMTQIELPEVTIKNDSGYFNAVENEKYGTYKLTLSAIDEDDHETERVVEIDFIDNSDEYLPKITGPRKVYKANNILLTIEDIKTLYKAEDENGNTLDVEVKNLTYLDNANKVGSYKVKVTATDSEDRTRELPVTIEVLDGCSDMWYIDPTEIHTTQHSALTIEQIMHEYEWYSGNEIFYYEVLDDTYSEMSDVPGTYKIEVEITNFEKQYVEEITIHVDEAATLVTAAEQNFLYWVSRFFDWLWNDIILFFC